MKKLLLLTIMVLVAMSSFFAQNVTSVTFTGQQQNKSYQKLDSVLITNMTQQWYEVLRYPDTVISLSNVGVADYESGNGMVCLYQNVPNPFQGVTNFNLTLANKEKVDLAIYDINGKMVAEYRNTLPCGEHHFRATMNTPQTYLLSAVSKSGSTSIKMLNLGNTGEQCRIELVSSLPLNNTFTKKESVHGFKVGDNMQYIGFATQNNVVKCDTVTKIQTVSETITFTFPAVEVSDSDITVTTDSAAVDTSVILYGHYKIKDAIIAAVGFEYKEFADSTFTQVECKDIASPFFVTLENLLPATKYTYVAYLITTEGSLVRGAEKTFTTGLQLVTIEEKAFNIENAVVQEYLSLSTATFSTKAGNYSQSFFDAQRSYRPDQPMCKEITFSDSQAKSAKVYLWTAENTVNKEFIENVVLKNGEGKCILRNLIPGRTYLYAVVAETGRTIATGGFNTSGQMRMIAIDYGFNIRDLGGWKGLDGKTIKYEQLYRGGSVGGADMYAQTSDIPEADKLELVRLGIRAHLDLRAEPNGGRYPNETSLHSYSALKTTLLQVDFNNTMSDEGLLNLDPSLISDIAWIIYELKNGHPVYFNCRQGADRTGAIAFIIEGLLGCAEYTNEKGGNQMALDYELTGFSQANLVDNLKATTTYRPAQRAYSSYTDRIFRKMFDLKASESDIQLTNLQQKCYYYLNRYNGFTSGPKDVHIDQADLDWFITYMLGMSQSEYAKYKPTWAQPGGDLKKVGEACANVVNYYSQE